MDQIGIKTEDKVNMQIQMISHRNDRSLQNNYLLFCDNISLKFWTIVQIGSLGVFLPEVHAAICAVCAN